jgi:hypothetical protein
MKKKIITVFLAHANLLFATQYYENPFNHQLDHPVGVRITSKVTSIQDGVPLDDVMSISELMSDRDYYGTSISKWKVTDTTAPSNGFPTISVGYAVYADGVLIDESEKDSDESEFNSLVSEIGSPPDKELWEIGETWETKRNSRETVQGLLSKNSILPSSFWVWKYTTKGTFLGLELIETLWGPLYAAKIKLDHTCQITFEDLIDANGTAVNLLKIRYDDAKSEETQYYIKGWGFYKSISKITFGQRVISATSILDGLHEASISSSDTEPSFISYVEQTLQSHTRGSISPTSFSAITLGENASTLYLDSWTWNGAYPWVYNANTDSWFYYYFKGSACNAYDARTSKWYTFDGQQKTWVNAN